MYNLNYNQLYYFYVVATLGSIKKACDQLHLTQPSISGGIKNLEDSLGVKLFDREYRQLTLNNNGKKIYEKAKLIFNLGEELLNDLHRSSSPSKKIINLGMANSVPSVIAVELIDLLWDKHKTQLNVEYGNSEELTNKIKSGEIDLFFTNDLNAQDYSFHYQKIIQSHYQVVGLKSYSHLSQNFPKSINQTPCVTLGENGFKNKIKNSDSININVIGTVYDSNILIQTAERGHCLALTDQLTAKQAIKSKELISIGEFTDIEFTIWGVTNHFSQNKSLIKNVLNEISHYFNGLLTSEGLKKELLSI